MAIAAGIVGDPLPRAELYTEKQAGLYVRRQMKRFLSRRARRTSATTRVA